MSELFGNQLGGQSVEQATNKIQQAGNLVEDLRLRAAVEAVNALSNLRTATIKSPSFRPITPAGKDPTVFNNVSKYSRTTFPIKDLKEYNAELIKINKNSTNLDKFFTLFTKRTTKELKGLNTEALKPINETLTKTNKIGLDLFRESEGWAGKLKKTLNGLETTFERIANITFGVTAVKIFTDSFFALRNEIDRVNSSLKLLNKSGFSLEMIESVNMFEDALMNLDTSNVEELATSFVSQYKNITSQLAQIGTLTQNEIKKATEQGKDYLGDYFDKVQNMVEKSLKSTVTSSDALAATYTALQAGLQEKGGQATVDTAVENTLKLVATQGGDANAVMELLVQTMTAFNLSASSTGDVLGKLNKLVDIGITSIPELQNGFGQLGVTAASAGVTFEEMSGSLAQLTLTGSTTFTAITNLNNLFNKIRSGSVTERLAELGVTLDGQAVRFDSSTVAVKGFTKALDDVYRAIGGSKQTFQDILGGDQQAVAGGLGVLKKEIESLDQLINQISTASVKNLEDAFNIKINNDQVLQFEQILNRVSEIALKLGKILAPLFSKGIERIEKNIDRIGYLVKNYGDLILKITELNLQMKAVNAMFGIVIGTILKLAGAYAVWFFASGRLQKNLGIIWNALTKKNEAIAKGNILWDKQTGMLKKVGAVIGQLVGVYDLERKGKAELTKEELKRIEEEVKSRAVQAAAHQDTMNQLEAQRKEYERLAKVKQDVNDVGVTGKQRVFQEAEEAKTKLSELETKQEVFQIQQKGTAEIDRTVRELEQKQVLTELDSKKLELLKNVQKRDNDIQTLETEIADLKRLKKSDNPELIDVRNAAIKEREQDLKTLKRQREYDVYENDLEIGEAKKTLRKEKASEKFISRMDKLNKDGVSRREEVAQKYKELEEQISTTKEEEEKRKKSMRILGKQLTMDSEISTSRNIRTLDNDRDARVERYRNERMLSYIKSNRDNPTFQGKVERQKQALEGKVSAGENLTANLGNSLSDLGGRVGGKFGSVLSGAGSLLFGASGALSLTGSVADAKGAILDPLKKDMKNTSSFLSGTFQTLTKGMGGLLRGMMSLINPTTIVIGALTALGVAIAKLALTSEEKTNLANQLYEDAGITPNEKPKSFWDNVTENFSTSVKGVFGFMAQRNEDYGKYTPIGALRNFISSTKLGESAKKTTNDYILNPITSYFNFGEKINANNVVAQGDVLANIFKQDELLGDIQKNTKNVTTRTFDNVVLDKIGDKNYTKTINTILNKDNINTKDVDLALKVKQKTVSALTNKLNKENEALQIRTKGADSLLLNAIQGSGLDDKQKEKLDSFSRKIIDERSRLKERLANNDINKEQYDKSLSEVNTGTSNVFTDQEKKFFNDVFNKLDSVAKNSLDTAMREKTLANEQKRLYEIEKRNVDAFTESADSIQSFIKNLGDVGNATTPEALAAKQSLDSKIKGLGEEITNFVKVIAPKKGEIISDKESIRAGQINTNLQNIIPGIISTIQNNAASGYSDDTKKAETLQNIIETNIKGKFKERGYSAEEAQRKTNALLKDYQIQTQIMNLENDDFEKKMVRYQKQKEVFEAAKQSEYLVTRKVIEDIQKIETKSLKDQQAFQKKRVEDLRKKVSEKDGLDPQVLIDAENELKITEQQIVTQRINQKRELLEYETKLISDQYDKRYAEIEEKVLTGEKKLTDLERIDLEANKQQEILALNLQTQVQLRNILQKEGKLNKETQIRIDKEIQQARVELLRSYIDEAINKYNSLADNIERIGNLELSYINSSINRLNVKSDIFNKITAILDQQRELFDSSQNALEKDANYVRNTLKNRREQIAFEKTYYDQRRKALAEQVKFERETLLLQKEQNKLLIERMKREQEIREKQATVGLKKALIKEQQAAQSGDPLKIAEAQGEREIAELEYQTAKLNRENIRLEEIRIRNDEKIKDYQQGLKEQQAYDDIAREQAASTRTRIDDIALAEQAKKRFLNGGVALPILDKPDVNMGSQITSANEEIEQIKKSVEVLTQPITKELKTNTSNIDKTLKDGFGKLKDIGSDYKKLTEKLVSEQKTLVKAQVLNFKNFTNEIVKTQNSLYRSYTKEIQGSFLDFLNNLPQGQTPKPKQENTGRKENISESKIEDIFQKTMIEMLKMSGVNFNKIPKQQLPSLRFVPYGHELREGAGGSYDFRNNILRIHESFKKSISNLDEDGMTVLIHELRHWMQDEGFTKGWLDPKKIKSKDARKRIQSGLNFSGNNKLEKDAYTYDTLHTKNIVKKLISSSSTNVKKSLGLKLQQQQDRTTTLDIPKEEYPGGKPNENWTIEEYYAYQKWMRERNPHLTMTFAPPEYYGITKSKNSRPEHLGIIYNQQSQFKYEGQQNKILSSLNTKKNMADKINENNTTTNNNAKNVNVTLSPKIEIKIEKENDQNLAKNTAQEINQQLFAIFNEVAYKI